MDTETEFIQFIHSTIWRKKRTQHSHSSFRSSERRVIYADDDFEYPSNWIENMVYFKNLLPGAVAVGHRGFRIRDDYEFDISIHSFLMLASRLWENWG